LSLDRAVAWGQRFIDVALQRPSGAGRPPWKPVRPRLLPNALLRDAEAYARAIDQFDVERNPRYRGNRQGRGETYCNIFAWDAGEALGVPLPHWVDADGSPTSPGRGVETSANDLVAWLEAYGPRFGWRPAGMEEATAAARRGRPAVAGWINPGGDGHIAVLRPTPEWDDMPIVAQAGALNSRAMRLDSAFPTAWLHGEVCFFINDCGNGSGLSEGRAIEGWEANLRVLDSPWGRGARVIRGLYRLAFLACSALAIVRALPAGRGGPGPRRGRGALPVVSLAVFGPLLALRWLRPPITPFMLATKLGLPVDDPAPARAIHRWVDLDQVSPDMLNAVLVSEDAYFFWHFGINPLEVWRAMRWRRSRYPADWRRPGGSTLTQQLAKNLFLLPAPTVRRKAAEFFLALAIEGLWPKRRILEMYLNVVHFGEGVFGVEAAARHYFGCSAAGLSSEQAALLTASLRRPYWLRVTEPPPEMLALQAEILERMAVASDRMLRHLEGGVRLRSGPGAAAEEEGGVVAAEAD
jgi:monofunctional biosynthetic peptidoglycan transglycosylase